MYEVNLMSLFYVCKTGSLPDDIAPSEGIGMGLWSREFVYSV